MNNDQDNSGEHDEDAPNMSNSSLSSQNSSDSEPDMEAPAPKSMPKTNEALELLGAGASYINRNK